MLVEFTVPGKPVPKGRPRVMRGGWTFTPKKTKQQENLIRMIALSKRQAMRVVAMGGSFRLSVIAYGANKLADWDNIGKLCSDSLNGVFWVDDRQVIDARVLKLSCPAGQERTEIRVESIS